MHSKQSRPEISSQLRVPVCFILFVLLIPNFFSVVCLDLRHYKAPGSNRKRWKRDNFVGELSNELKASPLSTLDGNSSSKSADYERKKFEKQTPAATRSSANGIGCGNLFNRSNSMNNLNHLQRIDLFMAGISQYVSYSDKLRDLSLEVRSADGNLLVIQCSKEEICLQWRKAIKLTIDNLANTFVCTYFFCLLLVSVFPKCLLSFSIFRCATLTNITCNGNTFTTWAGFPSVYLPSLNIFCQMARWGNTCPNSGGYLDISLSKVETFISSNHHRQ